MLIHPANPPATRKTPVARVRKRHSASSHHAALAHTKRAHDSQRQHRQRHALRQHLQQIRRPGLAQVAVDDGVDVDDRVRDDQLQKPAEQAADAARQHDGARRGDVRVGALFRQVEGRVVAGHGPDHGDEGHLLRC